MIRRRAAWALVIALALWALIPAVPDAHAFPDAEVQWSEGGGPPFSLGVTSTVSGFLLSSDERLLLSYSDVLELVDMGAYSLEPEQPPALSEDAETDGIIQGLAYNGAAEKILASQDDGDLLEFAIATITEDPLSVIVEEGSTLGPVAYDTVTAYSYVANNTSGTIEVVDTITSSVVTTITPVISGQSNFNMTDAIFVDATDEIYFTTDVGALLYVASGGTASTTIDLDVAGGAMLSAIDELPNGSEVWVVDYDTPAVYTVSTSTHSETDAEIVLTENSTGTDITITEVSDPTSTYAYVAGAWGVSVINTATRQVLDLGDDPGTDEEPIPTSAEPYLVDASSLEDGIVYVNFSTGDLGLITDRPVAVISGITYSGGGSAMGQGGSADITFMADRAGTYELRSGGGVDASGALIVDSTGATSGTVEANTSKTVTVNYDDNSENFDEGESEFWVFITDGDLRGRRKSWLSVDTPPPDVVVTSTGFGTNRVYVNMERLDVSDMSHYNIYVDTDAAAVLTKAEVGLEVAQPESGSTVTGDVTGLENGTTYYFAVEAVDTNGNKSANRTNRYSDGSLVTGMPEQTVGPVGYSGSTGCGLAESSEGSAAAWLLLPLAVLGLLALRMRRARAVLIVAALAAVLLCSSSAQAQPNIQETQATAGFSMLEDKPPQWFFELKTGFWMPTSSALERYFGKCCNLITRAQGGYMWQKRYGIEGGAGFLYKTGRARGAQTGETSQEKFSFLLIPMDLSFVWRVDYFSWRFLIPYMKAGFDGVFYRESVGGQSVKGMKWGMHAVGGAMLNISEMASTWGDKDLWVDEFFMTFEVEYQYIDSFGKKGLDLSGPVYSVGLLFYF